MTVLKAKIGGTFQSVLSGYASNVYTGPNPPTDPNVEFWVDTDAYLPVVPWIPVVFQNGWVEIAGVYTNTAYRKIDDMVQIRMNVRSGTVGQPIFTLPVGYRPPAYLVFPVVADQANPAAAFMAQIQIASTGTVSGFNMVAAGNIQAGDIQFSVTA